MGSWLALGVLIARVVLELLSIARATRERNEALVEAFGRVLNDAGKIVAAAQVARINAERIARAGRMRPERDEFCRDGEDSAGDLPGVGTDKVEQP